MAVFFGLTLGVLFGYYIISPLSVNFLAGYSVSDVVISSPTLKSYIQTITSVVLAAGVVFQLPILVFFLSKAGLVTPNFLKKYRRHAIILIVTLSAIITPPDVFSQILVAIPIEISSCQRYRLISDREAQRNRGETASSVVGKKKHF